MGNPALVVVRPPETSPLYIKEEHTNPDHSGTPSPSSRPHKPRLLSTSINTESTRSKLTTHETYTTRKKHIAPNGKALPLSTTIRPAERADAIEAWEYTRDSDNEALKLNQFLTLRPDIDHLTPYERESHWSAVLNKLRVTCRDLGFKFTAIMSRESDHENPGCGEHLHILMHIPPSKVKRLRDIVTLWPGRNWLTASDYVTTNKGGKRKCAIGYLMKAAHPHDRYRDQSILYRKSGPIIGWRVRTTRDLRVQLRAKLARQSKTDQRITQERALVANRSTLAAPVWSPISIVIPGLTGTRSAPNRHHENVTATPS